MREDNGTQQAEDTGAASINNDALATQRGRGHHQGRGRGGSRGACLSRSHPQASQGVFNPMQRSCANAEKKCFKCGNGVILHHIVKVLHVLSVGNGAIWLGSVQVQVGRMGLIKVLTTNPIRFFACVSESVVSKGGICSDVRSLVTVNDDKNRKFAIDSASSDHICNQKEMFTDLKECSGVVRMGKGSERIVGYGNVTIELTRDARYSIDISILLVRYSI